MRETLLTLCLLFFSNFLLGQFGPQQVISTSGDRPYRAYPVDINGDGNVDIVSASGLDTKIVWFKNLDGLGNFSSEIIIEQNSSYYLFDVIDIDTDGDFDIILEETGAPFRLYCMKNLDGNGDFGAPNLILDNIFDTLMSHNFVDIDNDNDLDLFIAFYQTFSIRFVYFENYDGMGNFSDEILLVDNSIYYISPLLEDIDQDGYKDLLTCIDEYAPAKFVWFKNFGEGNFGEEQEIYQFDFFQSDATSVITMKYVDINSDGKKDIIANCNNDDTVGLFEVWLENIDNQGNFYDPTDLFYVDAYDSYYDLDNDGDNDAIKKLWLSNQIIWNENINGLGNFETSRIITNDVINVAVVSASDLNNDGLLDIVSASYDDDKVAWYENTGILGFSEKEQPAITIFPNPVKGIIYLETEEEIESIAIYNSLGAKILTFSGTNQINVENLPQGIYLLKVLFSDGSATSEKIIKF
ncbi:MAG: T9SS type A sorting domain-containing protein [Flavobacteriaceae bacterium]|nr:T9SS type A sorting domain-containing protein [Flavobacteriaceae bacterium]